jgi:HEAT repeat protein
MAIRRIHAPLLLAAALAACGGKDEPKKSAKPEEKKAETAAPVPSGGTGLDLSALKRDGAAPAPAPEPAKPAAAAPAPALAQDPKPAPAPSPAPAPVVKKPDGPPPPISPDEISDTEVRMSWAQDEREAIDEMKPEEREKEMRKRRMEIFKQRGGVWVEPKKDAAAGADGEKGPARPDAKSARDAAPPDLRQILDDLGNSDPEVRARGADAATRYGDKSMMVRYIAPLLQDPDVELRAIAATTLGALKSTDGVGPLVALIEKGDKDQVRAVAIKALLDIGGREAVAGLRRIAREGEEGADRATALAMLIRLKEVGEIKGLIPGALNNLSGEVREQAVIAIREFQLREHDGVLVGLLKDSSERVQVEAMRTMGEFGMKSAVGPLVNVLLKPDEDADDLELLQNVANDALKKITNVDQGLRPDDPDEKRLAAIDGWRIWWKKNKDQYK